MIDPGKLKQFFRERPSISIRGVEREAQLPPTKIKEFIKGNQRLSAEQDAALQAVLKRYGALVLPEQGLGALLIKSLIE